LCFGCRIVAGRLELAGGLELRQSPIRTTGLRRQETKGGVGFKLLRIGGDRLPVVALRRILLAGGVFDKPEIEKSTGVLRVLLQITKQRETGGFVVVRFNPVLGSGKR